MKRNEPSNANTRIEQCATAGPASFSAPVQTSANITFVCPVSLDMMLDPVCTVDGQIYERSYIERWLKNNDTSPLTNLKLSSKKLVSNDAITSNLQHCEHQPESAEEDSEDTFECELQCGFLGSFSEVELHERTCTADAAEGSVETRVSGPVCTHAAMAQIRGARATSGCATACCVM